jgi:hypothetical protein
MEAGTVFKLVDAERGARAQILLGVRFKARSSPILPLYASQILLIPCGIQVLRDLPRPRTVR